MSIEVRQVCHPDAVRHFNAAELRRHFLIEELFVPDQIKLTYSHIDRLVVGGATPYLAAAEAGIGQADRLAEFPPPTGTRSREPRRPGRVHTDGQVHDLGARDALYVAMGTIDVRFKSVDGKPPQNSILSALLRTRGLRP